MELMPSSDVFSANYRRGKPQVVWATLVADMETPITAYLKLAGGEPFSFLLESVVSGERKDRYSFIGARPDLIWRCKRDDSFINRAALSNPKAYEKQQGTPLEALRALVEECRIDL
nr:anthranilate synthase component I [Alphaproteobacteria bacterium]